MLYLGCNFFSPITFQCPCVFFFKRLSYMVFHYPILNTAFLPPCLGARSRSGLGCQMEVEVWRYVGMRRGKGLRMRGASTVRMARAASVADGAPVYGRLDAFPFFCFIFLGRGVGELRMNSSCLRPWSWNGPFFFLPFSYCFFFF